MIFVQLNEKNFEYDIYSLLKAFYPGEEIVIAAEGPPARGEISFRLVIRYSADEITMENPDDPGEDCRVAVDYGNRKETKNRLKMLLYRLLERRLGRTLPWGTLTGIRPTKIPLGMMEAGEDADVIRAYMKSAYAVSDRKIELSMEIASRERKLLQKTDCDNGYSLYIGIPFCPGTCLYCSFPSYPAGAWKDRMGAYLDALDREIDFVAAHMSGKRLNTVYIGGGTPTSLDARLLERLLDKIASALDLDGLLEYTVEAGRPDSITADKLRVMAEHGVERISINPQTMNQKTLAIIGRSHSVEDIYRSFDMAREQGFSCINMDLIMGLPGETLADAAYTLEKVAAIAPDNLTVHSLAIKRSARLNIERENYLGYPIVNSQEHIDLAGECAQRLGMRPYYLYRQKNMAGNLENTGYALPGKEGLYNVLIMEEKQTIVACGAGSITKRVSGGRRISRCENVKDVGLYIERIDEMIERKRRLLTP